MWGRAKDRKSSAVLPEGDDVDHDADKYAPRGRMKSASPDGIRWSSPRTWIWLLLVANLLVVLTFIFSSALFFPDASTAEVLLHRPSLTHGTLTEDHSTSSLRPKSEAPLVLNQRDRLEESEQVEELTAAPKQQLDAELTDAVREIQPDGQAETPQQEASLAPVETTGASEVTTTTKQHVETDASPQLQDEAQTTGAEEAAAQALPSHIAGMLARVKATQQAVEQQKKEALSGESAPDALKGTPTGHGHSLRSRSEDEQQGTSHPALYQSLFVWLKADEGVKLVDRGACLESQNPDACELTSWTNQIRSTNALVPTAFKPASVLRPVWVPKTTADGSGLPSVAFSCPLKAKYASFPDSMTLFFVLSPVDIELGDSFAGQKFFGSSPYGQFALHGGKPAFFGSTGLVELNETLQPSRPSILVYRLQRQSVEIKTRDREWTPLPSEPRVIRLSQNDEISLGNAKPVCDTNAFRGHISEVMLYSVALDDEQVEEVEQYLQARYAVAVGTTKLSEQATSQQQPEQPAPSAVDEQLPAATENEETEGDGLVASDSEPHKQAQPVEEATSIAQPEPESPDDYDPELVFEWTPSKELLDAKGLPAAVAEQWADTVREKVEQIQTFQLGGDVLRELIHQHKEELLRLHDDLFGPSTRE